MAKRLSDTGYSEGVSSIGDLEGHTLRLKSVAFGNSRANGTYAEFITDRIDPATGEILEADSRVIGFGVQVLRVARHLAREMAEPNGRLSEPVDVTVKKEGDVVILE